jgi:hypothetical protein
MCAGRRVRSGVTSSGAVMLVKVAGVALVGVARDAVSMSPGHAVIAVPSRLGDLVAGGAGAMGQPAVSVQSGRWIDALGGYAGVLERLPADLDRVNGRAFALACSKSRDGAVAAFIASQIWGYGTNGYGPFRLRQALADRDLPQVLGGARVRVQNNDPVGAFRVLCVEHQIAHVGAAFGSKFLFFVDPHGRALILDRVVRSWLSKHAGLRLGGSRDEREYAVWLRVAAQWGAELNISVEQVERLIFTDGLDEGSAWRPATSSAEPPDRAARPPSSTATRAAGSRVILLGCVKSKLGHRAHAKDLYVSPLWQGRRRYAEASGQPWQILSAKHGLLDPEQTIAPYDVALAHLDADARGRWGQRVTQALTERYGSLIAMTFEVHAGDAYWRAIAPRLSELGATLSRPLARLTMGRQLGWYRTHHPTPMPPAVSEERRQRATPAEVRRAIRDLDGTPVRVAAIDWPAGLRGLDQPGLYSWWVDEPGARMLSTGLGHQIAPGRIYAGQTGATKWPSGRTGSMTLKKRIGRNHLAGQIAGSTFRLTLASILADQLELESSDARHLDRGSEQRLTDWMRTHLEVAVHRYATPDSLADLERHVLSELDPPLNLDGQRSRATRSRLADLRRQRARA